MTRYRLVSALASWLIIGCAGSPAPSATAPAPLAAPDSSAGREPADIRSVVHAASDRMRRCYDKGTARTPNLSGRVSVKIVIDHEGSVSNVTQWFEEQSASSSPSIHDREVVMCVLSEFMRLQFSSVRHAEPQTIVYAVTFSTSCAGMCLEPTDRRALTGNAPPAR